eukprot:TRINITY_DN11101_c0_g1_i1.p1 TRINITY_DN11101_c0_g1~~TRINITY_DN11101_c0_g1_i1.p1  ORF type:complete len:446 (-),score=147.12 TRINITY_DN11101_c0_g1_i1:7-1305(-)
MENKMEKKSKDGDKKNQKEAEIREKMKRRVEVEKKTFNIQSLLIESDKVTKQQLVDAAQYLTPEHYADVVYERSAAHLCGWPLCDQSVSAASVSGKYKVDRRVGIVEASAARDYHASTCLMNSKLYAQQLSNEPVYLRTKFTPPVIEQFQEHVSSPVTASPTDLPNLVIKERDTDNDVIEVPKLESAKTQAIEGYVSKNSSVPAVTPSFTETQKQDDESDPMPELEPVTRSDDQRDSESDDSDLDENIDLLGNFFISSKEIPIPELSIFGSLWTTYSHWITPETRHWLRGTEPSRDTDPSVTGVTHDFDVTADDSAVHALPATDSEAPELIRRNTVKHMLFKYIHMFGDDLFIERTPHHIDLLHHVLDSFDWHHVPKLTSQSAALTALVLLHVTLPRVSPASMDNFRAGLSRLLTKYNFTAEEFHTLAELFD